MLVGILGLGLVAIMWLAGWATGIESRRRAVELERDRFFELSVDLLVVFDAAGRFRKVNKSWERLMGYRDGALIGRSLFDLLHPDDRDGTIAAAQRHFGEGEEVVGFQNRYRHRDGSYRWLEWMSRMSPDLTLAYAVARDITERKHSEDRRRRRQRVLETRNDKLSERAIRDPQPGPTARATTRRRGGVPGVRPCARRDGKLPGAIGTDRYHHPDGHTAA